MTHEEKKLFHDNMLQQIHRHHYEAKAYATRLRNQHSFLVWITLLAIVAGTFLSFTAAVINDKSRMGEWRYICGMVGGLNAIAGICTMVAQRHQLDKRLGNAESCEGELNSLILALREGTRPWEDIFTEYRYIVERNPRILKVAHHLTNR